MTDDPRAGLKRDAAEAAATLVTDGMVVGLGTGSTAFFAIAALIRRVGEGLRIVAIPTSEHSAEQARAGGIVLTDFAAHPTIDLTIDGADAVADGSLDLIKGLGGALLREKIVASASRRLVIVVDDSKLVPQLGNTTPVPVEVVRFGWEATAAHIAALGAKITMRQDAAGAPFLTDGGNYILDCHFGAIGDPAALDRQLQAIVGLVETGLFIGRVSDVFAATAAGVRRITR
ncbi:MAG: ribose-5-phosphate isomerase RpiA [Acetobacteraceae bacterium]